MHNKPTVSALILVTLSLALNGCLAQSQIQAKYMSKESDCRDEAQNRVANSQQTGMNTLGYDNQIDSAYTLSSGFSECMNRGGWKVAVPKGPGSPPTNTASNTVPPPSGAPGPGGIVALKPTTANGNNPPAAPVIGPGAQPSPAAANVQQQSAPNGQSQAATYGQQQSATYGQPQRIYVQQPPQQPQNIYVQQPPQQPQNIYVQQPQQQPQTITVQQQPAPAQTINVQQPQQQPAPAQNIYVQQPQQQPQTINVQQPPAQPQAINVQNTYKPPANNVQNSYTVPPNAAAAAAAQDPNGAPLAGAIAGQGMAPGYIPPMVGQNIGVQGTNAAPPYAATRPYGTYMPEYGTGAGRQF